MSQFVFTPTTHTNVPRRPADSSAMTKCEVSSVSSVEGNTSIPGGSLPVELYSYSSSTIRKQTLETSQRKTGGPRLGQSWRMIKDHGCTVVVNKSGSLKMTAVNSCTALLQFTTLEYSSYHAAVVVFTGTRGIIVYVGTNM